MPNYLKEFLRIILELSEKNKVINDEVLFAEIDKVPGFRQYLEENKEMIDQMKLLAQNYRDN